MRYSYVMLPDYPLSESLAAIKLADELGFYRCYAADETWHKDLWLLRRSRRRDEEHPVRPSLSSVVLREPTLIAQSLATLDELTGGRRGRALLRQLRPARPVQHRLDDDEAAVTGERGPPRRAHAARRRSDHVRRRVLQVQRPVHVRPTGAGARPGADRRHARPEVVPGGR